jgi:hypothetical protein
MEYAQRIGAVLSQMGQLTPHDINEILAEQRTTGARFGEIALALGLVQPEHIWAAWCAQLAKQLERVDLYEIGIDAQAIEQVPAELARGLHVVPVRLCERELVVAVADATRVAGLAELAQRTNLSVRCVLADAGQIAGALSTYYSTPTLAAAG